MIMRHEAMKKKKKTVGCQWMEKITLKQHEIKQVREEINSKQKERRKGQGGYVCAKLKTLVDVNTLPCFKSP